MKFKIALLALALTSIGASCPPNPPTPTPTPTPLPPSTLFENMLLRNDGTGKLVTVTGAAIDFRGAIPCCMAFEGGNTGWPLFSKDWVDYTQLQGRANFYHARLGPFNTASEVAWNAYGGAYLELDKKVDLTKFNDKFWEEARKRVIYAGNKGAWVEIDLIDGWYCKHAQWGDLESGHPWLPEYNIQGENWAANCGKQIIAAGNVYDNFLRKAVETFGDLGNVIWQDGNEVGQIQGYKNDWTLSMRKRVQIHEKEVGKGLAHIFGTNSGVDEVMASDVDYINLHNQFPNNPWYGKPTGMNEVNPAPDPNAYVSTYCKGRLGGAYIWYWRSEHTKAQMDETLSRISQAGLNNCQDVDTSGCPYDVPTPSYIKVKPHGTDYYDSTPIICNTPYCRKIGYDDGRPCCPIRMEGDMFRAECEFKAMGGEINWWLIDKIGTIDIHPRNSNFQFLVTGNGSATVNCTFPTANGVNKCQDGSGRELRISR